MKRTARTTRVKVKLLTDPDPERVSLVRHGANQEPFRLVKADLAHAPQPMKKTPLAKGATSGTDDTVDMSTLHKAVFAITEFADEAAVTTFLNERGYSEFTVKADGDTGFVVEAAAADQFGTLSTVAVAKGVTYHVGERKAADGKEASAKTATAAPATTAATGAAGATPPAPGAEAAPTATAKTDDPPAPPAPTPTPVAKTAQPIRVRTRVALSAKPTAVIVDEFAACELRFGEFLIERADGTEGTVKIKELAAKYDYYGSYASTATTLADVLNDGLMDGVPVGYGDVMSAYRYAVRNAVLAGDVAAVKDISWELGLMLVKLASLTTAFTASKTLSDEDKAAALKAFGATEETFLLDDAPAREPVSPDAAFAALVAKIESLEKTVAEKLAQPPAPESAPTGADATENKVTQSRKSSDVSEPGADKKPSEAGEEGHGTPVAKEEQQRAAQAKTRIECDALGLRQPVTAKKP